MNIETRTASFYNEGGELIKTFAVFKEGFKIAELETEEEEAKQLEQTLKETSHNKNLKGGIIK